MAVRFIHTADVHLDSPLSGLSSFADAPIGTLRQATRRAFEGLVDQALAEQVDFLVIAGDLFDGTWKDYNTGLFFITQMGRLNQQGIRVVLLYGNHDADSELSRATRLRFPSNVSVFETTKAHSIAFDDLQVVLHGRSFWQRDIDDNLAKDYPAPVAGWFNIGVLHTALSGREGHARYAPCSLDELRAKGYQYWALGHVHAQELLAESPHIAFSGSLQGRHIREPGEHGAFLVEVDDAQVQMTRLCSDVLRWQTLRVAVADCGSCDEVLAAVEQSLGLALESSAGRPLAVRVVLEGQTSLHGALFAQQQHLRAQMQALALGFGPERAWIEKLKLETTPLALGDDPMTSSDVLADLQSMLAEANRDEELLALLERDFADLKTKLPLELRQAPEPMLERLLNARLPELIDVVAPSLLAQLGRS
jgi:DNA repair exonuclease SbcCD nuclease subunit